MKARKLAALALCIIALFLAGCFESKQDFSINPDGSGKVTLDVLFDPTAASMGQSDPQKAMDSAVKKIIKESKGVEVWKDVIYKMMPDGRVSFKGTAYFADINKLDISNYGTKFAITREGSSALLTMKDDKDEKGGKKPAAAPATPPTDEEIAAQIQKARGEWERTKPMMVAMLSGLKKSATVRLPGKVVEVNNFTKVSANVLSVSLDGAKLIDTLDKAMGDTDWLTAEAKGGGLDPQGGPPMDDTLNERYFGQAGPVSAKYEPGKKALFDYKKEAAAAAKLYPKLLDSLGIVGKTAAGTVLKDGVTFAVGEIKDNRTNGEFFAGMSVELLMSGDIVAHSKSVRNFEVVTATDDKGTDLRKDPSEGSSFSSSSSSSEEGKLKQQVDLKNPLRAAVSISELTGNVDLYVPDKDPKSKIVIKNIMKMTGKSVVSDVLKKMKIDVAVLNHDQYEAMKQKKQEAESSGSAPAGKDPVAMMLSIFSDSFSGYMGVDENGLAYLVKDPGNKVVELEIQDATGAPIQYQSRSGSGEMTVVDFAEALPDTAQLAIYVETTASMVRAPFSLANITLP